MDEKSNLFKVCVIQYAHASVANINIADFALIARAAIAGFAQIQCVYPVYIYNELIIKFSFLACASIKTNLNVFILNFFTYDYIRNSYSLLQDMKSIYFTHMLRLLIKYCFYHSKIKCRSSYQRVVLHLNMTKIKLTWITHVFFVQGVR